MIRVWASYLIVLVMAVLVGSDMEAAEPELLFFIARSTNANVVHYIANLTSQGDFTSEDPVSAYWIMAAEDGHREDLTWYENEHIYGFSVARDATGKTLVLTIKALKKFPIIVSLIAGVPRAETEIGAHMAILESAFVQASGGLFPGVDSVTLSGKDVTDGKDVESVIHP